VEYNGEVYVVSGDYKTENDGLSGAMEILKCDVFITESTFGLPVYKWKSQQEIFYDIQNWVMKNKKSGKNSVLIGYSLGKAKRLLTCLSEITSTIYVHGAIWNAHEALKNAGFALPDVKKIDVDAPRENFKEAVIIAPPGADSSPWVKRFSPYATGICSGWMQVRGNVRRLNADAGFALSDHADWDGLLQVIKSTEAKKIFVTHGFQSSLSRYLNESGIEAAEVKTEFGDEELPVTEAENKI